MLAYEEVKEVLDYNPSTGILKWADAAHHRVRGKVAGSANKAGYIDLKLKGKRIYAHRIAWFLTYGEWPKGQIDHINGNTSDNRIDNLRLVTDAENRKNMKRYSGNSSGVTGVYWNKRANKWQAYICVNYNIKYLGVFEFLVDAKRARENAEKEFGFHKNHGRITNNQN